MDTFSTLAPRSQQKERDPRADARGSVASGPHLGVPLIYHAGHAFIAAAPTASNSSRVTPSRAWIVMPWITVA
jgi:hypothetical protein